MKSDADRSSNLEDPIVKEQDGNSLSKSLFADNATSNKVTDTHEDRQEA